jgi:hypothetical protein
LNAKFLVVSFRGVTESGRRWERSDTALILLSRELLIGRTLQDAAAALEGGARQEGLALPDVAQRVDAELVLSRGGVLEAGSAPVLADLGYAGMASVGLDGVETLLPALEKHGQKLIAAYIPLNADPGLRRTCRRHHDTGA